MTKTTELTVNLPLTLSQEEAKLLFAVKLYEVGKVSLGQAAKLAGFSKRAFMEVLGRYQVPLFNYSAEELREETSV
jgi:predicted HTH domain antitoxin